MIFMLKQKNKKDVLITTEMYCKFESEAGIRTVSFHNAIVARSEIEPTKSHDAMKKYDEAAR